MKRLFNCLWAALAALTAGAATVGTWQSYPAYHAVSDIEPTGRLVYVLSSNDLFSYNVSDKSIVAYTKQHPLSDTYIHRIAWNATVGKLLIIYSNYNIDLLDEDENVENIADYRSKSTTLDRTVYDVTTNGIYAYVCTGFGVMKINMKTAEIYETYDLGTTVTWCAVADNCIYAHTLDDQVMKGDMSLNLVDKNNWTTGTMVAYDDPNALLNTTANGHTKYYVYDKTNKCYWANQADQKLMQYTEDADGNTTILARDIAPDGPYYNYFYNMRFKNGCLYTVPGAWYQLKMYGRQGAIQIYHRDSDAWTVYGDSVKPTYGTAFQDISSIDVDPKNANRIIVGSGTCGIYEFVNGKMVNNYTDGNSAGNIQAIISGNPDYVRADGVIFDSSGHLWLENSGSDNAIISLKSDGTWFTASPSVCLDSNGKSKAVLRNSIFDSRGLLWFSSDNSNYPGLFCYNTASGDIVHYNHFYNQDGTALSVYYMDCIAEDQNNNIWVGTNIGPLMLTAAQKADNSLGFTQVKVARNDGTDYADYLLNNIYITCMAVDSYGRKWFGTNGEGVYLISADNTVELHHFTADNSGLLSDEVESIAIDASTDLVYIGTTRGLCSYQSDSTGGSSEDMSEDNVWAYPNPFTPAHGSGYITITGLSYDADVKITTVNGTLVNEGRSTANTYQWNGRDLDGKLVASGVYMVLTAKSDGSKGVVCKLAIVR